MTSSTSETAPQLAIRDLHVDIGTGAETVHAVRGVSLSAAHGSRLGIVGESGSGKTMTANAILRVLPAGGRIVHGEIDFAGRDLVQLSERELDAIRGREISMVFQNAKAALNPVFPVGEQISAVYRRHTGAKRRAAWEHTVSMLARMGIPNPRERAHAYPHELSGGMAQRAMIAMGLICQPTLLLADEPTTGLDLTIQAQVLQVIDESLADRSTTLVLISHDIAVVRTLCDEVAVMYAGEVVEAGPMAVVLDQPTHPYTQKLVAAYLDDERPSSSSGPVQSSERGLGGRASVEPDDLDRGGDPGLRRRSEERFVACDKGEGGLE